MKPALNFACAAEDSSERRDADTKLPGMDASTVRVSSVVNSLPRWILNTKGSLKGFLLSILKPIGDVSSPTSRLKASAPPGASVWPMPVPYPEAFGSSQHGVCRVLWEKKLVSLQVIVLSWLHLNRPSSAPVFLRLGGWLTSKQWSAVKTMLRLVCDSNTPEFVSAVDMGRSASKYESVEKTLGAMARAVGSLHADGGYLKSGGSKPDVFDDSWLRCGSLVGRLPGSSTCTARPIVADRLNFPGRPLFDPVKFFDARTCELYLRPLDYSLDHRTCEVEVPHVSVRATEANKIDLFKKLADSGRLSPVKASLTRGKYCSGLFAVLKDSLRDRLILDSRPANALESQKTDWCGTMGIGTALCDISLEPDEELRMSGLDLRDFFYQFSISNQRIARNALAGTVTIDQAKLIFGDGFSWDEDPVHLALSTMAMGDLLACEFAQCSHMGLALQYEVCKPHELITLRLPVPRTPVIAGIVIDDLIVMEKIARDAQGGFPSYSVSEAKVRIDRALFGYEKENLEANIKKSFFGESEAKFWGFEVDGKAGLVRASSTRIWPVVAITARVCLLKYATVGLLEALAGGWVSILGARRRMLCLMNIVFEPLGLDDPQQIVSISPDLQDELMSLAVCALLAVSDLRSSYLPYVYASDASVEWMAAVRAPLHQNAVKEVCRFSLKKSTWSQLLPPGKAWLKSHDLLEVDDEVPGTAYDSHPLWVVLAGCLSYKERWRSPCKTGCHINLLELKAYLTEEKRICQAHCQSRFLFGLDSQVCLGSLVKGRSSSLAINNMLARHLCFVLGSGCQGYYMYFPSATNRADGPTRHSSPADPDVIYPEWLVALEAGYVEPFDQWLAKAEKGVVSFPFRFDDLLNGSHVDLRPAAMIPKRIKKAEKTRTTSTAVCNNEGDKEEIPKFPPSTGGKDSELVELLKSFPREQFICKDEQPDFTKPGALDLFSGCYGVARHLSLSGAPWVLTFEWKRSASEDLLDKDLRAKLVRLIELGAFKSVSMAPVCASFSRAITPAVRSVAKPRGLSGLTLNMRVKVQQGNSHADFCLSILELCEIYDIAYFLENPDSSWLWRLKGYKRFSGADSPYVFRLCFCRFGTPWMKPTRIATSTKLRGLRMWCACSQKHLQLRGYSKVHKKSWTSVAEPYPRGLSKLLATSLSVQAGWCHWKKLNVAGCSRTLSLRAGEASNPGPGVSNRRNRARVTLENLPVLSAATIALEARELERFIAWCGHYLRTMSPGEIFDAVPVFLGHCLRSYGDISFQNGGALSNFRHLILACQRWKPMFRAFAYPAWELVARWENQEPVNHRPPIPEALCKAICFLSWNFGWFDFIGATLLAFYGGGRIGEVLKCRRHDLVLPSDTFDPEQRCAFLQLRAFKSLNRQPARIQHMKITDVGAIHLLTAIFDNKSTKSLLFEGSPHQYRRRWDFLINLLKIEKNLRLTPGGLRGGAAVAMYRAERPISDIAWTLRLRHQGTLESYLQECSALTIFSSFSSETRSLIKTGAFLFTLLADGAVKLGS